VSAPLTLAEIKAQARRAREKVVALVILANDDLAIVEAGPRGGWRIVSQK
jgi:hypothetical protein